MGTWEGLRAPAARVSSRRRITASPSRASTATAPGRRGDRGAPALARQLGALDEDPGRGRARGGDADDEAPDLPAELSRHALAHAQGVGAVHGVFGGLAREDAAVGLVDRLGELAELVVHHGHEADQARRRADGGRAAREGQGRPRVSPVERGLRLGLEALGRLQRLALAAPAAASTARKRAPSHLTAQPLVRRHQHARIIAVSRLGGNRRRHVRRDDRRGLRLRRWAGGLSTLLRPVASTAGVGGRVRLLSLRARVGRGRFVARRRRGRVGRARARGRPRPARGRAAEGA